MSYPVWIKPALYGAGAGAVIAIFAGFNWGGWVTAGTAREMVTKQSSAATVAALTPYCVAKSQSDPQKDAVLAKLKSEASYNRGDVVANAGWATPLGAEEPNDALAEACQRALVADT